MRLTWTRLAVLVFVLAFVLGAVGVSWAQDQAAPAKKDLAFQNDAALIIFYIKPDKTADFEELMTKLKDGLAKMEAPEVKQQTASMKLFKTAVVAGAPTATYFLIADPVVKNTEYWIMSLLYKAYPNEAQALFAKWQDVKAATPAQPSLFDLTQVIKFQ
jgi:hypothetical protein